MTDEKVFTASNGLPVNPYGWIPLYEKCTHKEAHKARAEFYQHLRDKELGRWRDPENPDHVVYPADVDPEECWVVDEKYPPNFESWRREHIARGAYSMVFGYDTAKRYFEAHPETKSWHDAQPGEVWLVTAWGNEPEPMFVRGGNFIEAATWEIPVTSPLITHAEKIYPKDEDKK